MGLSLAAQAAGVPTSQVWASSAVGESFLQVASEAKEEAGWPKRRAALFTGTPPSKFIAQKSAYCSPWAQQAQIFKFYEDIPVLTMILKFNACALLS